MVCSGHEALLPDTAGWAGVYGVRDEGFAGGTVWMLRASAVGCTPGVSRLGRFGIYSGTMQPN